MEWQEITSQADANALLEAFGHFHDACLREAHILTGHWVSQDLAMSCPGGLDNSIRFLIQRQCRDPAAIELHFEQVIRFQLVAAAENHDAVILGATILLADDSIYWAPDSDWSPQSANAGNATWIQARKLRWRSVDWLGNTPRYGSNHS